jgi:hypothetical protein
MITGGVSRAAPAHGLHSTIRMLERVQALARRRLSPDSDGRQTDMTSKDLRDSEEERGESQRFKFLCQHIGVTSCDTNDSALTTTLVLTS